MTQQLQIQLLGTFTLSEAGKVISSLSQRERIQSLLGYLIVNRGQAVPRSTLAFQLWPESTDSQALTNLRRELHYLKRDLTHYDAFLTISNKTLCWEPSAPCDIDVEQFEKALEVAQAAETAGDAAASCEAWAAAAQCYKGRLLPHLYDEWLPAAQERLQQAAIRCLTTLVEGLQAQGQYRPAIAYAQQLLRLDPLNEAAYGSLIQLHALSGDRATALRLYHHCMGLLREELGVDPSANLQGIYEQLLNEPEIAAAEVAATEIAATEVEAAKVKTTRAKTTEAQNSTFDAEQVAKARESKSPLETKSSLETNIAETAVTETAKSPSNPAPLQSKIQTDWGEATDVSSFYGRQSELETLTDWVSRDSCRLVAILGMGGMGKTTLSVKFAQRMAEAAEAEFEVVIWRSLRYAPTWDALAADLLATISHQTPIEPSSARLMQGLREHRCLIVLDNVETVLQGGEEAGHCRPGYEGYGDLFRMVAEGSHQSCLMLTSREKPEAVAMGESMGEGMDMPVRSLSLKGSPEVAEAIIQTKGLFGTPAERQRLGARYDNMPLAIKIIASSIQELFDGEIEPFLAEEVFMASGLRRLLEQQFQRLSQLEQSIMDWLAINHEWTSVAELAEDLMPPVPRNAILSALESLRWRSLIEKQTTTDSQHSGWSEERKGKGRSRKSRYTQSPAVMEYVTETIIARVVDALTDDSFLKGDLEDAGLVLRKMPLHTHALLKATAQDYVRDQQRNLLLQPIIQALGSSSGGQIATMAQAWIARLQQEITGYPSYAAGNWLNLLVTAHVDLTGWDFSALDLRQAYLPTVALHQVNFSNCQLERSVFATTLTSILDLDWSSSGEWLATADVGGVLRVWQARDGQLLRVLSGHNNWIHSVAFSPDSRCLASGGEDATVRLWETETGEALGVLEGHGSRVWSVAFAPDSDSKRLVSASEDSTIRLWNLETGQCLQTLHGHGAGVNAVAWIDEQHFISGGADKTLRLWSIQGDCLGTLVGHEHGIWVIAVHPFVDPSGQRVFLIASGSQDGVIRLWNLPDITRLDAGTHGAGAQADGITCFATLKTPSRWVWSLRFGAAGRYLASGHDDGCIYRWETGLILPALAQSGATPEMQQQLQSQVQLFKGHQSRVWGLAFDPEGRQLVSGSKDQTLRFWDMSRQASLRTLRGYTNWVQAIAFHLPPDDPQADQNRSILAAYEDGHLRQWNLDTGELQAVLIGHQQPVWALAISPDGRHCASSGEDEAVYLWNLATQQRRLLPGKQGRVWSIDFSPDGQWLAFGRGNHRLVLWDLEAEKVQYALAGHGDRIWSVAFSPDGQTLASSSSDGTVRLWSVATGDCLATLLGHRGWVFCVCWSPDGQTLASSGSDGAILLWDVATAEKRAVLQSKTKLMLSVQFSPDGSWLASGSDDNLVRLWDVTTQSCTVLCQGHQGWVWSVAFSPDGQTLASGSQDTTLRLWDVATGQAQQKLQTLRPYEGLILKGTTGLTEGEQATLATLGGVMT